jgi:hypothetical protein
MSKGPGKIQNRLIALFQKNRERYFSTEELCRSVFDVWHVEKKHRVSVLRALKRISKPDRLNIYRAVRTHSNDDFWFIYGPALNSLLHKAKAENIVIAPAKHERPRKKRTRSGTSKDRRLRPFAGWYPTGRL